MPAVVVEVTNVEKHPTRDGLTVNTLSNGSIAVSNLRDNGSPRYKVGDLVVHIPEKSIIPEWLLKRQDCWDDVKGKGTLAGGKGNRVKNRKFDDIVSEGMLVSGINEVIAEILTQEEHEKLDDPLDSIVRQIRVSKQDISKSYRKNDDISDFFEVTEWEG